MPMFCDFVSCSGEEKILVPSILEQSRIGVWCLLGNGSGAKDFLQPCALAGFISCRWNTHDCKVWISYSAGLCGPGAAPLPLWLFFECFLKCERQANLEGCVCVWWVLAGECYSSVLESSWRAGVGFYLLCFSLYIYNKKSVSFSMDEVYLFQEDWNTGGLYHNLGYFLCVLTSAAAIWFPCGL